MRDRGEEWKALQRAVKLAGPGIEAHRRTLKRGSGPDGVLSGMARRSIEAMNDGAGPDEMQTRYLQRRVR